MLLTSYGAAQTVTGSMHLLQRGSTGGGTGPRLLLDCGLFQGRRADADAINRKLLFDAKIVDAVILSHAHIDHSGALPTLVKNGFRGNIYATPATRDLCAVMLRDAGFIQEHDAAYLNKKAERTGDKTRILPLYTDADVSATLERFVAVSYRRPFQPLDGFVATFLDAGHVLGSGVTQLEADEGGKKRRIAFTGDLGRRNMPILRDPEVPDRVEVLLSESTYGGRLHDPIEKMDEDLAAAVKRTVGRGGMVLIPSFSLERAQEILFAFARLYAKGADLPRVPVYVDSPLTVKITDVFKLHPEVFDEEIRGFIAQHGDPFGLPNLRYLSSVEDSMKLNTSKEPCVIIAASGMCEAGRILHHLQNHVEDKRTSILLVGYQAEHTLGRRIQERQPRVKIFGVERNLNAEVFVMAGFSAHADQNDLLAYFRACKEGGALRRIGLVHGEIDAMNALSGKIGEGHLGETFVPERGKTIEI